MAFKIEYTDLFGETYFSPTTYSDRADIRRAAHYARVTYIDGPNPTVEPSRRAIVTNVRVVPVQ